MVHTDSRENSAVDEKWRQTGVAHMECCKGCEAAFWSHSESSLKSHSSGTSAEQVEAIEAKVACYHVRDNVW